MLMIEARQISSLVELVVSMHCRTELKPGLGLQSMPFYSCQQWYGHIDQTFACWHINQGHVPLCPPHFSRTLPFWWGSLTKTTHAVSFSSTEQRAGSHSWHTDYDRRLCLLNSDGSPADLALFPVSLIPNPKHSLSWRNWCNWEHFLCSLSNQNHRRTFPFRLLLSRTQHVHILSCCQTST